MAARKARLVDTAAVLNSASIHLLRGMASVDRMTGLTRARLSALSVVVFGGPATLGALADAEGVTAPTMTRIVDGLVGLGLVTRERHPDSARQVLIAPTNAGTRLMEDARVRRLGVIVEAMKELSADDRDLVRRAAPVLAALAGRVPRVARGAAGDGSAESS